jgi:hypothetical protein
MPIDRKALLVWLRQVRDVLNRDWDPIGVYHGLGGDDWPESEYEHYASEIAGMISRNATDAELVDYLERIEVEWMSQGPFDRDRAMRAMEVVTALRKLGPPPSN